MTRSELEMSLDIASGAIEPVYPFNAPAEAIELYNGQIGGLASEDLHGVVELVPRPKLGIEWKTTDNRGRHTNKREVTLTLRRPHGPVELPAWIRDFGGGWANGITFGRVATPVTRVVAHWFNLPNMGNLDRLIRTTSDGGTHSWPGRWTTDAAGWRMTIDVRPDHQSIWSDLHRAHVYVMTHVMEVRRVDGSLFSPMDVEPVFEALHLSVSFAVGRFVAPMLRIGINEAGETIWEDWHPYHCHPAQSISSGWWYDGDSAAFTDLVQRAITVFLDPDNREPLRLQLTCVIHEQGLAM